MLGIARSFVMVAATVVVMLAVPAQAQMDDAQREAFRQQMAEQLRQAGVDVDGIRQQIQSTIQQAGIDPDELRQSVQQMREQLQSGTFDPAQWQGQFQQWGNALQNSGLIDPGLIQNRAGGGQLQLQRIREQLECSDEEWRVLEPRVQRVLTARTEAGADQTNALLANLRTANTSTELGQALVQLRQALADPNVDAATLDVRIMAVRMAQDKARKELKTAQRSLIDLLTIKQEATLVALGYLD